MLFATQVMKILPAVSRVNPDESIWTQTNMLILPALTLVLAVAPYIIRILRASMIEVLESDYVQMARLKGMPERIVLQRHALPNAVIPAIQVIALNLAWLAGGVVVVEYLFNYPGIGSGLVDAVSNRDVPVIQAIVLLIASLYVGFNLIADILTILVSPRLRTGLQ
jgi:peptide/nickel transport system permease protein